jgi:hypothetical protein
MYISPQVFRTSPSNGHETYSADFHIFRERGGGGVLHCKKGYRFPVRLQLGCHLPNSSWPGIIKLFPARESLVCDIPAGDGKTITLQCICSRDVKYETARLHELQERREIFSKGKASGDG